MKFLSHLVTESLAHFMRNESAWLINADMQPVFYMRIQRIHAFFSVIGVTVVTVSNKTIIKYLSDKECESQTFRNRSFI